MKSIVKSALVTLFVLLGATLVNQQLYAGTATAQDQEQPQSTSEEQQEQPAATNTYNYTAQPGDSYSLIARKAVQTFGIVKNVSLSQAQIIAAETFLTQSAGSPHLNAGEAVSVKESDVEAAVNRARELSDATLSLWQKYADRANFNTDSVGEAR